LCLVKSTHIIFYLFYVLLYLIYILNVETICESCQFSFFFFIIQFLSCFKYALPITKHLFISSLFVKLSKIILYDNASFIDIYFYEYFHLALALQTFLDTLSNILDKCLHFSLIKIEPVSSQATLGTFFSICCIYFSIKNAFFSFN
jgi:hypothetical protein